MATVRDMMRSFMMIGKSRNAINFSFSGMLPNGLTFSRASTAYYFNGDGILASAASDAARIDYDPLFLSLKGLLIEPSRTNYVRNSVLAGAITGTPGTLPTNWVRANGGGAAALTQTVVETGTEYGMPYVDVRLQGTTTSTGYINYISDSGYTYHPAAQGESWTGSFYTKLVGGTLTGITAVASSVYEISSGGSYLGGGNAAMSVVDASLRRGIYTRTLSYATTGYVNPQITLTTGIGAIDITLRFYQPQLEKASAVDSPIKTTTDVATRAADQLTFTIPTSVTRLRYTFDDASTQDVSVSAGAYTVPTTLNRPWIKRIVGYKS